MTKRFYKLLLLLVIAIQLPAQNSDSLFMESARNKKKYRLAPIQIQGADYTDRNVIALLSGLIEGEEVTIPGDKISDAIKKLWKQGMFEDVQILQDKIVGNDLFLIIKVVERPRLTKFNFKGNVKKTEADELRTKIRLLKERVVTDYLIGTIKNTVHDYYLEKGYYFNKVDITQVKDTTAKTPHTILTIRVTKGRKVRIGEVNFI
jgi:outer membrane protein insertion porin family